MFDQLIANLGMPPPDEIVTQTGPGGQGDMMPQVAPGICQILARGVWDWSVGGGGAATHIRILGLGR